MRIDLGALDARALALALPSASPTGAERRATLISAANLRGLLETQQTGWKLTELGADEVLLRAVSWAFGKVQLFSEEPARLTGLRGAVQQEASQFRLELTLDALDAVRLALVVGELRLSARVTAEELTLAQGAGEGVLRAKRAVFREFEVSLGRLHASAPELRVAELVVDWGGAAFRLEVDAAEAASLDLASGETHLRATGLELLALRSLGAHVRLGQLKLSTCDLETDLAGSAGERGDERTAAQPLSLDLELLDGLAGRLSVDVDVDLSVPILGRRRARHELRLGIERGSIDFLEFEHGLSTLEDALLDFSVREGALVLERGLPLLSTRGRGKPLVLWDLEPSDHALAAGENRVRLAVLPRAQLAETDGEREKNGGGAFKLRALSLRSLAADLSLLQNRAGSSGWLPELTFTTLNVQGEIHHRPDELLPGTVRAQASELRAVVQGLPLSRGAGAGRLEIAALREVEVSFAGVKPTRLRAALEGVTLASFQLA